MKKVLKGLSTSVLVFALAGCGSAADTNMNGDKESHTSSGNENSGIVAGSIVPNLTEETKDGGHRYSYQLKNDKAEDVKLTMNSSQSFDFQLINDSGTVVYKDSDNTMYTQMLQEKILKPGEVLEMKFDLTDVLSTLPPGTYTLEVWSTANEAEDGWKFSTEVSWNGKSSASADLKLKVEEASVTYVGRQDLNSIEVINDQNESEAMRLSEVVKPFFDELQDGSRITVSYVFINGQKVIQSATIN